MGVFRALGLMSGTSMDGIDAAIIETDGKYRIKQIATASLKYDTATQAMLKTAEYVMSESLGNSKIADADFQKLAKKFTKLHYPHLSELSELWTMEKITRISRELHEKLVKKILKKFNLPADDIDLIGYHGQTLYHKPENKITLQVGDGQKLADNTSIKVINNFRMNDVMQGGQGAPLAPIYHQALAVRDNIFPLLVINCGGIANITYITGKEHQDIIGFDTGPANILLDKLVRARTNNTELYDKNAKYGKKGRVNDKVITLLLQNSIIKNGKNYFETLPPKSLCSSDIVMIDEIEQLSLEDACANLANFTAFTIFDSVRKLNLGLPKKWLVVGGGAKNPLIIAQLAKYFGTKPVKIMWDKTYMEAELMAYMAVRSFIKLPLSFPSTTCVKVPCLGGDLYHPTNL